MATRFYTQSTGTPAVSPTYGAMWEKTSGATRRPMSTTVANSAHAYATDTGTGSNPNDVLLWQLISEPLAAQTISGTFGGSFAAYETNNGLDAFMQVRVSIVNSSGVEQSVLYAGNTDTTSGISNVSANDQEFRGTSSASASGRYFTFSLTSQTAAATDRLCIEVGFRAPSTSTATGAVRVGDPTADTDLPASGQTGTGEAATLRSWIEFSGTITFAGAGSDLTGAATTELPAAAGSLTGFNASNVTGAVTTVLPAAVGVLLSASLLTGGATTVDPTAAGDLAAAQPTITGAATTENPTASGSLNSDPGNTLAGAATTVDPTATGSLTGLNASSLTGAVTTTDPTATGSLSGLNASSVTGAATTELPTAAGSLDVGEPPGPIEACVDLADAIILFETGTIDGSELVPDVVGNLFWMISAPVLEAGLRYDWEFVFEGGDYGDSDIDSTIGIYATTGTDATTAEADVASWYTLYEQEGPYSSTETIRIDPDDHDDYADQIADDRIYFVFSAPTQSGVSSLCYSIVDPDTLPAEIDDPEPVEDDQDIVGVDPVDQDDHDEEWHEYPAVSVPSAGGLAFDKAFVLEEDGSQTVLSLPGQRTRIIVGGVDVSSVNGIRTPAPDFELAKPFSFDTGTLRIPGLNPLTADLNGVAWLVPWAKVIVQRVDDEDAIVATDYRGRVASIDTDGAEVTLDLRGMFTGPAAEQWRPKALVKRRRDVTYWLHAMFRKNRQPLDYDAEDEFGVTITTPSQGYHLNCALDVVAQSVKRNGDTLAVAYDEDAHKWVASTSDRETIHATMYLDHGQMRQSFKRDFTAEKNQVYAAGHDESGRKILFAVAPGMEQVDPIPDYPLASGDPFGVGTVDADTTDGAGISRLILRLIVLGYLQRDDKDGGFDDDVAQAVEQARVDAKLSDFEFNFWWGTGPTSDPLREMVDEDLWAWLWDNEASGYTMKEARIRPAWEVPELGKYNFTATGQLKGINDDHDPSVIPVSEVIDFSTAMRKGQMHRRARRSVVTGANWHGQVTTNFGLIEGEHNPGDAFTEDMIVPLRAVRPDWNIWVPNFAGGVIMALSSISISRGEDMVDTATLSLDTRARDDMTLQAILDRDEQNRLSPSKAFRKQVSGNFSKDTLTGWVGEIGGKLGGDVVCPAGQWTVLPIPVGDYGLVQKIRTRLRTYLSELGGEGLGSSFSDGPEGVRHAVMAFGQKVTNGDGEAPFLNSRRPDPFSAGDFDDFRDNMDDFKDKRLLGAWGGQNQDDSFEFGGYGEFGEGGGGPLTGNFIDSAGFPFEAPDCVLYLAVYPEQDAVAVAGRHIWWQLDEGT